MWIIVCTSPHWHLSVGAMCHLCRLAAQRPCPVRKRFSVDHVGRRRLKPGNLMVGLEIRFLLVILLNILVHVTQIYSKIYRSCSLDWPAVHPLYLSPVMRVMRVRVQGVRRLVRPDRKRPRVESLMPSSS